VKLEWFKSNNVSLRCMRITQKEVRLPASWRLQKLGFLFFRWTSRGTCARMQEKNMRSKLNSKYIILETRKDGTKFTSKRMREHANLLNDHTAQYADVQKTLMTSVCHCAGALHTAAVTCIEHLA
jgi:DNA mismatch repair ATPase MutS